MTVHPLAAEVGLEVEEVLRIENPDDAHFDEEADLVIVGLGGAGVAAAVEGLERGLKVIAIDRYEGGGSTAANGGVFYAGGGTVIQKAAGEEDDKEEMLAYLKMEAGDVVSERTLRKFVDESVETVDWILKHGGKFGPGVWKEKSSYPPLDKFLYHPDNSLVASYAKKAKPAARGHRAYGNNKNKAWGLGRFVTEPMTQSALRMGLVFHRHTEARQLIVDGNGRVIGVRALSIPAGTPEAKAFAKYIERASTLLAMLPPSIPMAGATIRLGQYYLKKAQKIEHRARIERRIRAREGVVLSAGGFIMNPQMVERYAPAYTKGMPNGTLGDQGSGIVLGMTAGGATALMDKISSWRFINPPKVWAECPAVNREGKRFVNETLYGSSLGEAIVDFQGGTAWLIYDSDARELAFKQARDPNLVPFQRDVTLLNLAFNAVRAPTIEALAKKIDMDPETLAGTIEEYNGIANSDEPDAFGKEAKEVRPVKEGPFYAMDISIDSKFLPLAVITFGGLQVDEDSGLVLDKTGNPIPGLYAAGRCAVGLASQTYVSGLSFADCYFSGRRAARHAARANA